MCVSYSYVYNPSSHNNNAQPIKMIVIFWMMNAHPFSFYIYTYIFRFTPSQCTGPLQWHVLNSPFQFYLFPVLCVVYYTTFYKKLCKLRINISELVLYLYRPHPCIYSMYNSCCKNIVYVKTVNELNFYTYHFTSASKDGGRKLTCFEGSFRSV